MFNTARTGPSRSWVVRSLAAVAMITSAAMSYIIIGAWREAATLKTAAMAKPSPAPPVNPFASASGLNLIAYVITSSDCGWSRLPATLHAVSSIREKLLAAHGKKYAKVSVVGVALDSDPDKGIAFLKEMGRGKIGGAFDQIVVGGSWLNEQIVRVVWRERMASAASPQVVVVERLVDTES